jgi:hypothetical protein
MPRPSKGVRLYKRKPRYRNGKVVAQALWIIKDGARHIATGCVASPTETKPPREAEQALADYHRSKVSTRTPPAGYRGHRMCRCAVDLFDRYRRAGQPVRDRSQGRTAQRILGRQKIVGGQGSDLCGLRQTSRQPRWCTPRPRDVSRRNQPSCKGRLSPWLSARVAPAQGRSPRSVAHAKGSSSVDLALLAISGEANNPQWGGKG